MSVKGCYTSSFSTGKDETVSVKGCYSSCFSTVKDGTVSVKGCYTSCSSSQQIKKKIFLKEKENI